MLRRVVSVLAALVLVAQGALALASPPCAHASVDAAPALLADAHAGHGAHAGHAMQGAHEGHGGASSPSHGCGEDCRCASSCAASGLHAIAVPALDWPARYASVAPNRLPETQRALAHVSRLLRPPIVS